ncbi:surface lipoprotein assembly modifier [Leeia sp.]|uniref:surface lipoprotein assembly modifier n=1 Tax=Leeia sp. TaxID=2884678 RepID=UPI0035AFEB4B
MRLTRTLLAASCLLASSALFAAGHPALASAQQMLSRKQPAAAFKLLAPLAPQLSGDPEFDYLLGIAALDSGNPTEAVFALERVVDTQPDNQPARLELARAHFMLGEKAAAREAFQTVKDANPPKAALSTINQYLNAIDGPEAGKTRIHGYVQAGLGRDSNVNSATTIQKVAIPLLGGLTVNLSDNSLAQRDRYVSMGAGFDIRHNLDDDLVWTGSVDAQWRENHRWDAFDVHGLTAQTGLTWLRPSDSYSMGLVGQTLQVDHNSYRTLKGINGQWIHALDAQAQIGLYAQLARLHYPGQSARDANRSVLGAAYAEQLDDDSMMYSSVYLGREAVRNGNYPQLGHKLFGFRLGGEWNLRPDLKLFIQSSLERRRYGGQESLFKSSRRDRQLDLRIGLSYTPIKNLTLTPSLSWTRSRSNIGIHDYRRTQADLTVRYDFE